VRSSDRLISFQNRFDLRSALVWPRTSGASFQTGNHRLDDSGDSCGRSRVGFTPVLAARDAISDRSAEFSDSARLAGGPRRVLSRGTPRRTLAVSRSRRDEKPVFGGTSLDWEAVLWGGCGRLDQLTADRRSRQHRSGSFSRLSDAWFVMDGVNRGRDLSIRGGQVQRHREWIIRSYALTAAAITLRSPLPVLLVSGVSYAISYRIVAWACWIPDLVFAGCFLRRRRLTVAELAGSPPSRGAILK
jgi:hypothetical protein